MTSTTESLRGGEIRSPLDARHANPGSWSTGDGSSSGWVSGSGSIQQAGRVVLGLLGQSERLTVEAVLGLGEIDESGVVGLWGYTSTERMVAHELGRSNHEARRLVQAARHVHRHGPTRAALAAGEVTVAQVEVLALAASGFDEIYAEHEASLVDACRGRGVDELGRLCRTWRDRHDGDKARTDAKHRFEQRGLTIQVGFDGSAKGTFSLDPIGAELVNAALETRPDCAGLVDEPRTLKQRRADKLVDVCHESLHDADCTCHQQTSPANDHRDDAPGESGPTITETDPSPDSSPDPETSGPAGPDQSGRARPKSSARPGPRSQPAAGPEPSTEVEPVSGPVTPCSGRRGGSKAIANVVIDIRTLAGDANDPTDVDQVRSELAYGGPIFGPALDRILCDASFRALITDGPRTILAMNRATPDISPSLRQAIRIRDQHCQFCGCDRHHTWCDLHHIIPRHRGGPTSHDNLILLCRHHHGLVHDGGWALARAPNGTVTVHSP
ncbi:MAG: DUF222 domain-containing protein [Actinomycetia bacterium]|nr:DUF222 domain-containing protein [Actinomycetes bacterium]